MRMIAALPWLFYNLYCTAYIMLGYILVRNVQLYTFEVKSCWNYPTTHQQLLLPTMETTGREMTSVLGGR